MGSHSEEGAGVLTPSLQELIDRSQEPLGNPCVSGDVASLAKDGRLGATELGELLMARNGFYSFGSALLVRPLRNRSEPLGIEEWNAEGLWKHEYEGRLDSLLCFAEDVFGSQFALSEDAIVLVDPETGECEQIGRSLEEWASAILQDADYRTGQPLAREWEMKNGRLSPGYRLLPKVPFVTGGKFVVDNLYAGADVEGMQFRGSIARQIRDVPDGGHVTFEVEPPRES